MISPGYSFWILLFPDIAKPIGGVKQLHRVCEILLSLGFDCHLVQEDPSFHPEWFDSNVKTVSRKSWLSRHDLNPNVDIIVIPETFLPAIDSFHPLIKKIIFNQNSSYTFGLPGHHCDVNKTELYYLHPHVIQVWCISSHDHQFIANTLRASTTKPHRIINALTSVDSLSHSVPKKKQICFMPRKNSRDAEIVTSLLASQKVLDTWRVVAIDKCAHSDVLKTFEKSLIYLSFGHPEGFGLPVAEAMACGCAVVGYTGLGGRELFRIKSSARINHEVEFGDWFGFVQGVLLINSRLKNNPDLFLSQLAFHAMKIKSLYSTYNMTSSIANAINDIKLV
ncbi:hypothetical protein N8458_01355 [Synechococcus sp. AH-601-P18]|nr:hypothetical protein [Synechococcus sp. AH-601-P18]